MTGESSTSRNDELLTMMEEMQDEIENLRSKNGSLQDQLKQETLKKKGIDSEVQQTISDLSSQISALKKKVQAQKQEIVNLNEYIGKLSKSDLQLKEALSMKSAAQEAVAESSRLISDYKEMVDKKIASLDERDNAITQKEKRVSAIENNLEGEITQRVNSRVSRIEDDLEKAYRDKKWEIIRDYRELTAKHLMGYIVMGIVSFFAIVYAVVTSKSLRLEVKEFMYGFYVIIKGIVMFPYSTGTFLSKLAFDRAASPVPFWIMSIIIMIILYGAILFVIVKASVFLIDNIAECLCDGVTVVVMSIIISMIIFLSPVLYDMPINLLLAGLIVFIIYMIIRFLMAWDLQDQKMRNLLMIIIFIVSAFIVFGLVKLVS